MMQQSDRIWSCSLLALTGLVIIYLFTKDTFFIFDLFLFVGLLVFCLLLFLFIIIHDFRAYRENRDSSVFKTTLFAIGICISTFITIKAVNQFNDSPVVLYASYDGGFNRSFFTLKENGSYEFQDTNPFGVENFKGKYVIKDNIIILDRQIVGGVIKSNKLTVKAQRTHFGAETIVNYLFQLDSTGMPDLNSASFIVHNDYRKK